MTRRVKHGGGWPAIAYALSKARQAGGFFKLYRAMRSKNACKTCALGMGGQQGGMVNEAGRFPEVCKKSLQAMVADMQGAIPPDFWREHSVDRLQQLSPRQLEISGRLAQPMLYTRGATHYTPISWDEAYRRIAARLDSLTAEGGLQICGNAQNCVAVCPKEIPLTTSIARAGRATTLHAIKQWFDQ